ncbi:hypothetical protein GUJ93_ZPchr0005g15302 [Zizania palustris]|uniref:Uncharacterized protein n=1 Tax=Zizania palustris TaxID=103762 RepID=A0A8J5VCH6_ZIZPA|nr:hypothetical protein GUJ93_ZPchr0005g15302 [Zizania palustris]
MLPSSGEGGDDGEAEAPSAPRVSCSACLAVPVVLWLSLRLSGLLSLSVSLVFCLSCSVLSRRTKRLVSALSFAMLLWATITEGLHRANNIHHDLDTQCPTAKTGLFGGAAFLALDASLFWLVAQMLALNARSDYLDEDDKGDYGQVYASDGDGPKV